MRPEAMIAAALLAAGAATAAAQPVATDPAPPPPPQGEPVQVQVVAEPAAPIAVEPIPIAEPEPYAHPPYEPARDPVPRESTLFLVGASQAHMTGDDGGLEVFAHGATIGFGFLQRDGDFPTGAEVTAVFLRGEDASMYDLQVRLYGSPELGRKRAVPYVAVGLAVGAARLVTAEDKQRGRQPSYGLSIGPSASLGLHGFLGDKLYWRGGAGLLGTGIGAITADLGLGFVIGG